MFDFVSAEYSAIGCILIDARCLPAVREHIPAPTAYPGTLSAGLSGGVYAGRRGKAD